MKSFSTQGIASFIVRYMLSHKRLSLEILKAEFNMNDLQVRNTLIRLFYQNRKFGYLKKVDSGNIFLIFSNKNPNAFTQ